MKAIRQWLLRLDETAPFVSFFVLLVSVMITASVATDVYVPSLPHITQFFNTSADLTKITVSIYLVGYALSQLFYGPLSDHYGRRPFLVWGFLLGIIGTLLCAYADSIEMLIFARFVQGVGLGAGNALTRSISVDVFKGERLVMMVSYLGIALGIAPAVAPVLGGLLEDSWGWRSVFLCFSIYIVFQWVIILLFFPETNPNRSIEPLSVGKVLKRYAMVCCNRTFLSYVLISGLSMGSYLSFFTVSAYFFQNGLGVSVMGYSWIVLSLALTILLSKILNVILLKYFSLRQIIGVGIWILVLGTVAVLLPAILGWMTLTSVLLPLIGYSLGFGLITGNIMVEAFAPFPAVYAGTLAAIYSFLQIVTGFSASLFATHLPNSSIVPVGSLMLGLSVVQLLVWQQMQRNTESDDDEPEPESEPLNELEEP